MIVAVEGLDGAGKTTVSRILAGRLDATYVGLPPPDLLLATTALFRRHDSLARYLYYLSGAAAIAEMARAGSTLVADRYVASAHALHLHVPGGAAEHLEQLPIRPPELTLYLEVDEEVRRARLNLRRIPLDPFEQALNDSDQFRNDVAMRLRSSPATHVVETSGRTPEEVVDVAMRIVDRTINGGRDVGSQR